jgi:hypothetical protein
MSLPESTTIKGGAYTYGSRWDQSMAVDEDVRSPIYHYQQGCTDEKSTINKDDMTSIKDPRVRSRRSLIYGRRKKRIILLHIMKAKDMYTVLTLVIIDTPSIIYLRQAQD